VVGRPFAVDHADRGTAGRGAQRPADPGAARPSDRVELSDRARYLAKLAQVPTVRQGLIDQVRSQIEAGVYDTPERFEAALDGLIEDADQTV
jgi:hypothetical protein